MIVETDEAVVEDGETVEAMKKRLDGVVLNFHNLSHQGFENPVIRTVRQLEDMGVVTSITLHCK